MKRTVTMSSVAFHGGLIFFGFLVIGLLVLTKARTAADFFQDPLLLIYTMFVTCFELSRIISAMLYNNRAYHDAVDDRARHYEPDSFEPQVSIVIPCMNEEASIAETVEKCYLADYPHDKLEVIVINDGSTDGTLDELRRMQRQFPDLVVINWTENRGKRHGMAEGFMRARGEIIVQLDSDSYIEPETFREIIRPFRNKHVGAVCAHADPANADLNLLTKLQAAYYFLSFRILKAAESTFFTVFCCSGCSSAYRKSVVLPIMQTWLEEQFLGLPVTWGDDRALTNWVIRRGYKTIYTDAAKAFTLCPTTLSQLLKQQVRWKKGWFVNSISASKFIWRDHPFVAFTYFFPLIFITMITPFMATKALLYDPIVRGIMPYYYIMGVVLISALVTLYYRYVSRENKYWPYVFVWSGLNMLVLSFVLYYALFSIQNRKWGTRG